MRIIAWGSIANLVAAAVALALVTAATQPPAAITIAEGKPHVGIAPAPLPPLRRLRRDTPEKDGRDPEKASYTPDGHWDLCHYHYQAVKDEYELLSRIRSVTSSFYSPPSPRYSEAATLSVPSLQQVARSLDSHAFACLPPAPPPPRAQLGRILRTPGAAHRGRAPRAFPAVGICRHATVPAG